MPELRFTADTHPDLVRQVRAWLDSLDEEQRTAADIVAGQADLTKDALRIVASAAPAPVADSEILTRLTSMGYRATDLTRDGVLAGLDGIAAVTDGRLVRKASSSGAKVVYEMNATAARQILKSILGG